MWVHALDVRHKGFFFRLLQPFELSVCDGDATLVLLEVIAGDTVVRRYEEFLVLIDISDLLSECRIFSKELYTYSWYSSSSFGATIGSMS